MNMEHGNRYPYGPRGSPFSPSNPSFLQPRGSPYRQQWRPYHHSTPTQYTANSSSSFSSSGYRTPTPISSPDFVPLSTSPEIRTPPSSGKSPAWENRRFSNDRNSGSGAGHRRGNFRGRGNFNRNFSPYQPHSRGNYQNKSFNNSSQSDCNPGHAADISAYIGPHIFEDPWKNLMVEHNKKLEKEKVE